MAKKKTTTTKKSTTTTKKTTTKKATTAKKTTSKKKKDETIDETFANSLVENAAGHDEISILPRMDSYDASLEQIQKYKEAHPDEEFDIDLEDVKKMAQAGFTAVIIDDESNDVPEEVKATLNFADEVMKRAAEEE